MTHNRLRAIACMLLLLAAGAGAAALAGAERSHQPNPPLMVRGN